MCKQHWLHCRVNVVANLNMSNSVQIFIKVLFVIHGFSVWCVRAQSDYSGSNRHVDEHRVRNLLLRDYKADVIPPESPLTVFFGLSVNAIRELDPVQQILTVEGYMIMYWYDSRLEWEVDEYAEIKQIKVSNKHVWHPDIKLYNRAKISETGPLGRVNTVVDNTGKVIWVPPTSLYSVCAIDFKYYPYDRHTCQLKFGSWTHDISSMDIQLMTNASGRVTEDDTLDNYVEGGEWAVAGISVTRTLQYYKCCPKPYPAITYQLKLRRRAPFYAYTILCPVIGSVLLTLATYWMSPLAYERITLNCVSLFIMFSTLLHLSFKLPSVGKSVPLIVVFCGSFVVILTVMTIFNVVLLMFGRSKRTTPMPRQMKAFIESALVTFLCVGWNTPVLDSSVRLPELKSLEVNPENVKCLTKSEEIRQQWFNFYQVVDRLLYIIFLFIMIIILAAAAS